MKRLLLLSCMTTIGCATGDGNGRFAMPMPSEIPPTIAAPVETTDAAPEVQQRRKKPPLRRVEKNAVVFSFHEDRTYDVAAPVGKITVVMLAPGETLKGTTLVGNPGTDKNRKWEVIETIGGTASGQSAMIAVRPIEANSETNVAIFGTAHTYLVNFRAIEGRAPSIAKWVYPDDPEPASERARQLPPDISVPQFDPNIINRNFRIAGDRPAWTPTTVFELGDRTFIEFPDQPGRIGAPALFATDENGKTKPLQFIATGRFYELSSRFRTAELRGDGATVTITRGS